MDKGKLKKKQRRSFKNEMGRAPKDDQELGIFVHGMSYSAEEFEKLVRKFVFSGVGDL